MLIKIEDLAPKNIINFYPPQPLCCQDSAKLFTKPLPENLSLIRALAELPELESCLVSDVLLSLKYADSAHKEDVKALVLAELDDYLSAAQQPLDFGQTAADLDFLEALADAFIRPTLNRDKGDIKIISYQNNELLLQFTGHCSGCPYAQNTLNNVVAGCFKRYVPQLGSIRVKE